MLSKQYTKILSISVMAHPSREKFFSYLKEKLGDVPFSIDRYSEGVWPNAKKAWAMFDPLAAYHVVIQDDAVICDDFVHHAEEAILKACEVVPDNLPPISFYFGNRGTLKGIARDGMKDGYCFMPRTPWAVAICLPTELIPEMLAFTENLAVPQDDVRIGQFIRSKEMRVYFPLPSLIDHRTGEESLVGDEGMNRQAFAFINNREKNI